MNLQTLKNYPNAKLRPVCDMDAETIAVHYCPPWSTPTEIREKWNRCHQEHQSGIRVVAVLEMDQEILGYGSLLLKSEYPHFLNIPEINDVWIYEKHRGHGLGTLLITWLEDVARKKGYKEIGIGVGLYADYGRAQKLYFHLGYTPDGHGVTHKCQPVIPGESYPFDDDLILWLKKPIIN